MPRKRKGYADPQRAAVQPNRAPTGLPQGEHKALKDAQSSVPLPNAKGRLDAAISAAQTSGGLGGSLLTGPTARPAEPVTAGIPIGPGPGVSAMQPPAVPVQQDDINMARWLPMLEALVDDPNATAASRNFVRRLRGSLPPGVTMEGLVREHS
jgi:hypothetical protein